MEKYIEFMDLAKRKFTIADHMVNITYPLVRDTRLLLASMENIFLVFTSAMAGLLHYERLYKRIPPFNDTFDSKFFMYSRMCQDRYKLDNSYAVLMKDLKNIIVQHKTSPVEFSRKDKLVICSDSYNMLVLTFSRIREYVSKAKLFIDEIESIIGKHERNLRRSNK